LTTLQLLTAPVADTPQLKVTNPEASSSMASGG
jgi:hypothetical protein